jgi:DNA-binding transcriptional ArsR family regulator
MKYLYTKSKEKIKKDLDRLKNFYWNELEFTTESLIKDIKRSNSDTYYYGYSDSIISKHLSDLEKEGYLNIRYVSVKMGPNNEYDSTRNSNNHKERFGSKTISVYKMIKI